MAVRFNVYLFSVIDTDSAIMPGARLYFYETDSSTPLATYSDPELSTPNPNPVLADASGRFPDIWLQPEPYKVQFTDPDGTPLDTLDPIYGTAAPGSVTADSLSTDTAELTGITEKLLYQNPDTGTVQQSVARVLQNFRWASEWGVEENGTDDETLKAQKALDWAAQNGGKLRFAGKALKTSNPLYLKGLSGSSISSRGAEVDFAGMTLIQTNPSASWPRDGLVVGDPPAADGGTGTAINIADVKVSNLKGQGCRIVLWGGYCDNLTVRNVWGDETAVVAIGNDANFDARNVDVEGVFRTAPFDNTFFTLGVFSTVNGTFRNIRSPYSISGNAVTFKTSNQIVASDLVIDQQNRLHGGIEIIEGCRYIAISNFTILNAINGIITFDTGPSFDKVAIIGNGTIGACDRGLNVLAGNTIFHHIDIVGSTTSDLFLGTDATGNIFDTIRFRRGLLSDASNVKALQTFANCSGITGRCAVYATSTTGGSNVTGDGTAYTRTWNNVEYDIGGNLNGGTGVFTAPVDGLYEFTGGTFLVDQPASGFTSAQMMIAYTGGSIALDYRTTTSNVYLHGTARVFLSRGNTARLVVTASGGTRAADINGDPSFNFLSVALVAGNQI